MLLRAGIESSNGNWQRVDGYLRRARAESPAQCGMSCPVPQRTWCVGTADHVTIHASSASAGGGARPGRLLVGCSPYDLEVHRAIDADAIDTATALPTYVRRVHDLRLGAAVAAAAAGPQRRAGVGRGFVHR